MKTALPLRPYQREALDAVKKAKHQRPVIVLPTGGGKTVCFAHDAREHLAECPGGRFLVLVHTDELVAQAAQKIKDVAPHLVVGIVKAARNEVHADVVVASVQTLRNEKRRAQLRGITRIIVDECHHAVARTYVDILKHFGAFTPGGPVAVGYTATLMRGDGKALSGVWEGVAFQRDIGWMVRKRYLVPPRGRAIEVPDLNLANVKSTRTDYRDGELGEALAESLAPELVAAAIVEHAAGRKGLLFAPTVASAYVFAEAMEALGLKVEVVHGGLAPDERKAILDRHRAGVTEWLCNCMILTEGYDDPTVSCIVVARPTKSKALYIQIVGRGLRVDPARPYEDQDCLILDVVGASTIHDLRTLADLSDKAITEKEAHSGRTLLELEDELDAGEGVEPDAPEFWTGPVESREFDPLGKPTTSVWLRTKGGTWFVPAGKLGYVFIMEYPERGQWSVCWCGTRTSYLFAVDADGIPRPAERGAPGARPVGMTEHRGLPLDQALVWAGDLAVDMGADLNTKRSASWRKKIASEPLQRFARDLGLEVQGHTDLSGLFVCDERMGALSDRVNLVVGSRRIDPVVASVRGR